MAETYSLENIKAALDKAMDDYLDLDKRLTDWENQRIAMEAFLSTCVWRNPGAKHTGIPESRDHEPHRTANGDCGWKKNQYFDDILPTIQSLRGQRDAQKLKAEQLQITYDTMLNTGAMEGSVALVSEKSQALDSTSLQKNVITVVVIIVAVVGLFLVFKYLVKLF